MHYGRYLFVVIVVVVARIVVSASILHLSLLL